MENDLFLPRQSNALYVYYNALHGHESEAYKRLGASKKQAFQNFQLSFSNNTDSSSITEALNLLKIAGEHELKKESAYCNALLQKMKDSGITLPLKTGHEILPSVDNADSIFSLYKTLNDLLKSQQVAEAIIQNELNYWEQIQKQEEAINEKIKLIQEQKILPTDTDEIKQQKQITARKIRYGVYNSILPKRTARDINEEVSAIAGEIANAHNKLKPLIETVISEFGPVLFQHKNGKLVLNSAQIVLLIREISRLILQRLRTDNSKPRKTKKNITNIIKTLWDKDAQKQQLIDSLKRASLSHYTVFETSKASDISILKNFLTNAEYQKITEQFGPYPLSNNPFSTLINQHSSKKTITNVDLLNKNNNEYEILMNALNYMDIKVWEEAELESATELVVNALSNYSYHHGKSKVLKADSEAGYLHYSCSIDEDKIRSAIQRTERTMETLSRKLEQELKVGAATTDYKSNYQAYQTNRKQQINALEKLRKKLEQQGVVLNEILTQFNIHTSNKFQSGILDLYANSELKGTGYFGGAVGEGDRGFSVIDNIQTLAAKTGSMMSSIDADSLKLLLINTAPIAVGSKLKDPLEKYFSMFVGYLLFDDAFNIAEDAAASITAEAEKFEVSVKDIHLFNFDGLYVPLSYILLQSYAALSGEYSKIKIDGSNSMPAKAVILNADHPDEPGVAESDWDREAKNAKDNTRIKVILMQNFLAFLSKLK